MKHAEPIEVQIARIDENVKHIKETIVPIRKKVDMHDKELWAVRFVTLAAAILAAAKYPMIAEAVGKVFLP